MKPRGWVVVAVVILGSCGLAKAWSRTFPQSQSEVSPPDEVPSPEVIGEGIISTDEDELGGGVMPDGQTFDLREVGGAALFVHHVRIASGEWRLEQAGNFAVLRAISRYRSGDRARWRVNFVCVGSAGGWEGFASVVDLAGAADEEREHRRQRGWW